MKLPSLSDKEDTLFTKLQLRLGMYTAALAVFVWPIAFYFTTNYAIAALQKEVEAVTQTVRVHEDKLVRFDTTGSNFGEQNRAMVYKITAIVEGQEQRLRYIETSMATVAADVSWLRKAQEEKTKRQ